MYGGLGADGLRTTFDPTHRHRARCGQRRDDAGLRPPERVPESLGDGHCDPWGATVWTYTCSAQNISSPLVAADAVVVLCPDATMAILDPATGQVRNVLTVPGQRVPLGVGSLTAAGPALAQGMLLVAAGGSLTKFGP